MQGTQYAPRGSILCMEHFVTLQGGCRYFERIKNCAFVSQKYRFGSEKYTHLRSTIIVLAIENVVHDDRKHLFGYR